MTPRCAVRFTLTLVRVYGTAVSRNGHRRYWHQADRLLEISLPMAIPAAEASLEIVNWRLPKSRCRHQRSTVGSERIPVVQHERTITGQQLV